jgi:hypothetical protein
VFRHEETAADFERFPMQLLRFNRLTFAIESVGDMTRTPGHPVCGPSEKVNLTAKKLPIAGGEDPLDASPAQESSAADGGFSVPRRTGCQAGIPGKTGPNGDNGKSPENA